MVAEKKNESVAVARGFFEKCCSRPGNGGVDFFWRWSNVKARYFDVRVGHRCRSRGLGEGRFGV